MANYKKRESPFTDRLRKKLASYLSEQDQYINTVAVKTGINRTTLSNFIHHKSSLSFEFGARLQSFLEGYR